MTDHTTDNMNDTMNDNGKTKINQETAKMPWHELQRFFAKGDVLFVDASEDLVDVAYQMANDNLPAIEALMQTQKLYPVTDAQAQDWHASNAVLWTVVIKPWLLVQPVVEPVIEPADSDSDNA